MTPRCCPMLTAAWLLAAAPLAQAGDLRLSASGDSSAAQAGGEEGWTMGASADPVPPQGGGLRGAEVFAGYRGALRGLGYGAQVGVRSYPGPHLGSHGVRMAEGLDGHAELSAGVNWKSLYARYDVSIGRDYLGIAGARGSGYLDVGARHPIGKATFLNLNAGDARVAGIGNGPWNWKDLRAGFSRKLDDGWIMALNVRRVYGNSVLADRRVALRSEGHPAIARGRRGLVLTFKRGF